MTCQENALGSLPRPPPRIIGLPGKRSKLLEMHASWEHRQSAALVLTLFSALDGFPESQMRTDVVLAAAARQSGGAQHKVTLL